MLIYAMLCYAMLCYAMLCYQVREALEASEVIGNTTWHYDKDGKMKARPVGPQVKTHVRKIASLTHNHGAQLA